MALVITLALGLFFVVGMLSARFFRNSETLEHISVAVAFGAMLGIGVLDIFPELLEIVEPSVWFLPVIGSFIGFGMLVLLDHFIPEHEDEHEDLYSEENLVHIGMISCVAIVIHNIIEGMAVYSLAVQNISSGMMLMIGVGLHNLPMGMFIYSTLRSKTDWKRYLFMFMASISTFIGGLLMMLVEPMITVSFDGVLYGMALGMIVYIVVMELWPYIRKNPAKLKSSICAFIGLIIVLISTFME